MPCALGTDEEKFICVLRFGGDMARKGKKTEGAMGDGMLDLRHTGVTRLNIPPAGFIKNYNGDKAWHYLLT